MPINQQEIIRAAVEACAAATNGAELDAVRHRVNEAYRLLPAEARKPVDDAWFGAHSRVAGPRVATQPTSTPAAIAGPAQTNASAELSRLRGQVAELSRENATLKETVSRQAARLQTLTAQQAAIDEKAAKVRQFRNSCGSESLAKVAAGITIPPAGRM